MLYRNISWKYRLKTSMVKILIINLAFILIVITANVINNLVIKESMEKEIIEANNNYIGYISKVIDTYLDEIHYTMFKYANNEDIIYLNNTENFSGEATIRLLRLRESLLKLKYTNPIVSDIWLYFSSMKLALTTEGTFFVNESFIDIMENNKNSMELFKIISSNKLANIKDGMESLNKIHKSENSIMEDVTFLYHTTLINKNITLLVSLNKDELCNMLSESNFNSENRILMLTYDTKLLASNINPFNLEMDMHRLTEDINSGYFKQGIVLMNRTTKYITNSYASKSGSIFYVTLFPLYEIERKIHVIDRNMIYLTVIILLMESVVIFLLYFVFVNPLKKIMKLLNVGLNKKEIRRNEFEIINFKLKEMNEEKQKSREVIESQITTIEDLYLYKLANEMTENLEDTVVCNLKNKYPLFFVATIVVEYTSGRIENNSLSDFLEYMRQAIACHVLTDEKKRITLLIQINDIPMYQERLFQLEKSISEILNDTSYAICGISNTCTDIMVVGKMIEQSHNALLYRDIKVRKTVYVYRDDCLEEKQECIAMSLSEENIFINHIMNGNIKYIKDFFDEITFYTYNKTFINYRELCAYLINIAKIIANSKNIKYKDLTKRMGQECDKMIDEMYDFEEIRKYLATIFETLTLMIKEGERDIDKYMIDFVISNYNKPICLNFLADELNMSPVYLSKYFKKVTGENFVSYVSRLRVEKAKELLRKTNKIIKDISEETGFSDVKYFIKIFKQYEGLTPGNYKKNINNS